MSIRKSSSFVCIHDWCSTDNSGFETHSVFSLDCPSVFIQVCRSIEMKKLYRIARDDLATLLFIDIGKSFLDDRLRLRPVSGGVGEVTAPDHDIHANFMAALHAPRVAHEPPQAVFFQILAGLSRRR